MKKENKAIPLITCECGYNNQPNNIKKYGRYFKRKWLVIMLKVKVFDCEHENDLTNEINDFIKEISKQDKEVIDIKFSTSVYINDDDQIFCFSSLVMYDDKIYEKYKPKRYEIIEKVDDN